MWHWPLSSKLSFFDLKSTKCPDQDPVLATWRKTMCLCSCGGGNDLHGEGGEIFRVQLKPIQRTELLVEAHLLAGVENTPRMMSLPCILKMGLVECSRLK